MKHSLLIFLLSFTLAGTACSGNHCTITGTWNKKSKKEIKLFAVESGVMKEIASTQLDEDNRFAFDFEAKKEGLFVIANETKAYITGIHTFYFKPGDALNVTVNADNSYTLEGNNTPENKELERWHEFIAPLEQKSIYFMEKSSTYVDFFPELEEKLAALADYKTEYTGNKSFTEVFGAMRKYDVMLYALHFLRTPRSTHPQGEDFPDYYRNISVTDFTASPRLLDHPYGAEIVYAWMVTFPMYDNTILTDEQRAAERDFKLRYGVIVDKVVNDVVKGELTLLMTRSFKSREGLLDFENTYGKYLVTDDQKQRMAYIIETVSENAAAPVPAPDFSFADATGKVISLSDFKGKVVYVDVWATWCVPCRAEMPKLKELEKEYHGKDIVFLSVSVDPQKDYAKWERFVIEHELKGVQLFAGDKAKELDLPYGIRSIPRFILVGKDGSLIEKDAPRPSSSEIKVVLDAALKK